MHENKFDENKTYCAICVESVNIRTFQNHLNSRKHHCNFKTQGRIDKKAAEVAEKGVIIKGAPVELGIKALLTYFNQFGDLLAIGKLCSGDIVVQFENSCSAAEACKSQEHTIEGAKILAIPRERKIYTGGFNGEAAAFSRLKQKLETHFDETSHGSLNDQLMELVTIFQASESWRSAKFQITSDLSEWLRLKFPDHAIHMFGSSAIAFDFDDCSDMDLCLQYNPDTFETDSQETKMEIMKLAASIVSAHPDVILLNLAPANVPVAKFVHTQSGIMFDLVIESLKGVKNSKFMNFLQTLDPRIRPFLFILKLWAKVHKITGNPHLAFKTYAVMLLGIFYLQRVSPPLIPPIASLQLKVPADQRDLHRGWNFSYPMPDKLPADENQTKQHSIFTLLKGFFNFYQSFDNKGFVICPLLGDALPREKYSSIPQSLDDIAFEPYLKYLSDGGKPFSFGQRLAIQDPFELNINVTAGVAKYEPFRKLCEKSFTICCDLEAASGQGNCNISPLFNPSR